MAMYSSVSDYLHRGFLRWRRRRTNRIIRNLPLEIQKDIGWPDSNREQRRKLYQPESF
ncbi:hypothetical protein [Chelativorans sp. YIM 93263]|uniref:hypothetical protein n=1 Tax=Chelativorans sp. YIM 93263 TaxID=2906648 RepID=UPI0023795DBA|nr:hypothetical protein [Chelativorans sp. YIM 93263]